MDNNLTIPVDQLGNTTDPLAVPPAQNPQTTLESFTLPTVPTQDTQAQQQQTLAEQQKASKQSEQDLISALFQTETQGARTLAAEEAAGLPKLQTELTDITNQLNTKQLEFRRAQEAIMNEAGLTSAQRQARLADVSRKQNSELADLEIVRQARSNSLANAQSIIQRKTELQFADEQARINNLKFIYDNNKEALTKTEDRQYQELIKREDRAFEVAKNEYQAVENEKLALVRNAQANGASNQVMQSILGAKTLQDAYSAAGVYGTSIDDKIKRAQLSKLYAELTPAQASSAESIVSDIQNIDGILENVGGLSSAVGPRSVSRRGLFRKGTKQDYIASVEQLTSQLSLDSLIKAKGEGATFGALSDSELRILAASATKIGSWTKRDKNGKVVGFEAPEGAFQKELERIKGYAEKDFKKRTGLEYSQVSQQLTEPDITIDESGNIVIPSLELTNEEFFK